MKKNIFEITVFILFLFLITAMAVWAQDAYPWQEVTSRLQAQIDDCRRGTRDFSTIERRLDEAEARILFLEAQLDLILNGEKEKAAMHYYFEKGLGYE